MEETTTPSVEQIDQPKKVSKKKAIKTTKEIRREYSDKEITEMAKKMIQTMKDKESIKERAKIASDEFKTELANKDLEIDQLSNCVTNGFQYETVEVEMIKNFETGKREFWFKDVIVETEDLTAQDHQLELDMAEKANKKEMDRIAKEEGTKKTKELNDLAALDEKQTAELTPEQLQQIDEFIKLGDEDHKSKRYSEALTFYNAALKLKPNDKAISNKILRTQNWIDKKKAEETES